jgi:DNA excision repair protein ERCC-2
VKVNGLSIRGRNEMCLNETILELKADPRESMSVCSDLRKNRNCKYFINLLKKRENVDNPVLISPEIFNQPFDADVLLELCKEKNLCPYFLSKFLLTEMKVVICNYQWIFNPFIRQSFLKFIGKELEQCILVLDECHNVVDVATDVNSLTITPYSLRLCLRDLESYRSPTEMQRFVNILLNHLEKKKNTMNVDEKGIEPEGVLNKIIKKMGLPDLTRFNNFLTDLYDFSTQIHEEKLASGDISRDYIGSLADFWLKWIRTYTQDSYFFSYNLSRRKDKKNISMEIVALDPREITVPILKSCYSSLHLSGTVNPYVYSNLLGLNQSGKSYKAIIAKSPFDKKNVKALIIEGIDTRRESRTAIMYKKIIERIDEILYCTPANVGIFCASYKVLDALVKNNIEAVIRKNNKTLFIEEPGLSATQNSYMVKDFKSMAESTDRGGVLLGVCGGRNSEGEDYPGKTMNSVIIVGLPYHLPTPRINAKIDYYDEVFDKQGWNFAYLYPAMQRANQASGRPIRKVTDKGAIIFMDSRFKQKFQWIADWVKKVIEIIPDKPNAITQNLYPFWNK